MTLKKDCGEIADVTHLDLDETLQEVTGEIRDNDLNFSTCKASVSIALTSDIDLSICESVFLEDSSVSFQLMTDTPNNSALSIEANTSDPLREEFNNFIPVNSVPNIESTDLNENDSCRELNALAEVLTDDLQENNQNSCNNQGDRKISSPFKRALFWPGEIKKNQVNRKRLPKLKVPAVAVSEKWMEYYSQKEEKRIQSEVEAANRKKVRKEKADAKTKALKIKKEEREKKEQRKLKFKD